MYRDEFLNQLHKGIHLNSRHIFDNLGIRIDLRTLPSWDLYFLMWELQYGSGFWGRLWAQRLRPLLMPKRHHQIDMAFVDVRRIHQREFMNAVLKRGEEIAS